MRRAKIVATLGSAISSRQNTLAALKAGVDVARMNVSRGDNGWDELVVIASGSRHGVAGSTNMLKVHKVRDLAAGGHLRKGRQRPAKEKVDLWPAVHCEEETA